MEGEELQVIEDGDMEDWLKVTILMCYSIMYFIGKVTLMFSVQVCNSCGQVGYVPERYVQLLCLPAEGSTPLDSSFSSTSSTVTKKTPGSRGPWPCLHLHLTLHYLLCTLYK